MQSTNSSKAFTIGNICVRDPDSVISIVSDYEGRKIDNRAVWGTISRTTSETGQAGNIIGNLSGYGCRFEIDESSFNLGTILKPTSLKIFSKDKFKHHAVFLKDSGALVLGEGKESSLEGNILETWAGICHWKGLVRFKDTVAFLPPEAVEGDLSPGAPGAGGVKVLTDVMFYHGSSISFSSMANPNDPSVFLEDSSPSLVIKGPTEITLGEDPQDISENKIELILPGMMPSPDSFLQYKNKEESLVWSRGMFSELALSTVGLESLTTSQLIALVMEMKLAIEALTGKTIPIVKDYEQALKDGDEIVPPGGTSAPGDGSGSGSTGVDPANGVGTISAINSPAIFSGQVSVGQTFTVAVVFTGTDGLTSPGPAITLDFSPNISGDSGTGVAFGTPKWNPSSATYTFVYTANAPGSAYLTIGPYDSTGGSTTTIPFTVV